MSRSPHGILRNYEGPEIVRACTRKPAHIHTYIRSVIIYIYIYIRVHVYIIIIRYRPTSVARAHVCLAGKFPEIRPTPTELFRRIVSRRQSAPAPSSAVSHSSHVPPPTPRELFPSPFLPQRSYVTLSSSLFEKYTRMRRRTYYYLCVYCRVYSGVFSTIFRGRIENRYIEYRSSTCDERNSTK